MTHASASTRARAGSWFVLELWDAHATLVRPEQAKPSSSEPPARLAPFLGMAAIARRGRGHRRGRFGGGLTATGKRGATTQRWRRRLADGRCGRGPSRLSRASGPGLTGMQPIVVAKVRRSPEINGESDGYCTYIGTRPFASTCWFFVHFFGLLCLLFIFASVWYILSSLNSACESWCFCFILIVLYSFPPCPREKDHDGLVRPERHHSAKRHCNRYVTTTCHVMNEEN